MKLTLRKEVSFLLIMAVSLVMVLWAAQEVPRRWAYAETQGRTQALRESLPGMTQARQLSELYRQVAQAVSPAVVEVRVVKRVEVEAPSGLEEFFEGLPPQFRRRFSIPETPRE
ncbi:MAG: hypothetical protein ACOC95_10070, partial [Planctomycetota bacterium]